MNKILIFLVSLMTIGLIGGAVFAGWYYQNQKYQTKVKELSAQITEKQAEVDELKASKDGNGYTPRDMATNFMNEFKNSSDKAKLYLSESLQSADLKARLAISNPAQLTVTEVTQEVSGDNAVATVKGYVTSETNGFTVILSMTKVENLWKISQIN